jgi:hypothetical protein
VLERVNVETSVVEGQNCQRYNQQTGKHYGTNDHRKRTAVNVYFHHTLSTRVQVSVHHIGQQVIKHILFVNFIQIQYIIPFSSTSKSVPVRFSACPVPLPKAETCAKMKPENKETKLSLRWLLLHIECKVNSTGDTNYSQCSVFNVVYNTLVNC